MSKDELEKIVLGCIDDLASQELTDSQAQLMIGFVDNLRQRAADADQSDHFASEVDRILGNLKAKRS